MPPIAKRFLIAMGAIALCVVGWLVYRHFNPEVAIDFTQAELQAKLAQKFPAEKCAPLNLACFVVREPKLTLKNDFDRIEVATTFALRVGAREYPGRANFNTKIRYNPQLGAFFLYDVEIVDFSTEGRLGDFDSMVRTQGDLIIGTLLRTTPVFTLKNDSRDQQIAKAVVRDVKIVDGKVRVVLLSSTK
jgi:hypothetical protein